MARAPKQWVLTKQETINSFENWRQNLEYTLSLDTNFGEFLEPGYTWSKKTKDSPLHGFKDDGEDVPHASRRTAVQKSAQLDLMLGQIANFCPVISRNAITRLSTSLAQIWQTIRLHYGFQTTGAHFLDLCSISLGVDERPEDLYQRLLSFIDDSLLRPEFGITHHGMMPSEEEEISPTLENFITLHWLRLLHPDLPALVKQKYGPELRSRTLASIKPEISQALDSLMAELRSNEDVKVLRTAAENFRLPRRSQTHSSSQGGHRRPASPTSSRRGQPPQPAAGRPSQRSCALCQAAGRPGSNTHYLSRCRYLPEPDRRFLAGVRLIVGCEEDNEDFNPSAPTDESVPSDTASKVSHPDPVTEIINTGSADSVCRVQTSKSPHLSVFYGHYPLRLTLDSGAEVNLMRNSVAKLLGVSISKTSQAAYQADGHSALNVIGETRMCVQRGNHVLQLDALVVDGLDVDVLAGTPFMRVNDVSIRPAACTVSIGNSVVFRYDAGDSAVSVKPAARRAHCTLRASPSAQTLWPGEYLELDVPDFTPDSQVAVEPTICSPRPGDPDSTWPHPTVTQLVSSKIRVPNLSDSPVHIRPHSHLCKVYSVSTPGASDSSVLDGQSPTQVKVEPQLAPHHPPLASIAAVQIDPDSILSGAMRSEFAAVTSEHSSVFDPVFPGYNGAKGHIEGIVNIGPVQPPQSPGRVPQYERNRLNELQEKFDELESLGVFRKPEDLGIVVEYVNPSFLVNKPGGGTRLVTDFSSIGRYCKPQPSMLPDVESTLRTIGGWRYLISTDVTKAYHQVPMSKSSMKYCGVSTPFKGTRIYSRCAMGIPGSESALEELLCRVLGDLLKEGRVVKLADDLFCGGNTPKEALDNWRLVLKALESCDLRLSASKTVICPRSTTVLGWVWSEGKLSASPHRISTLSTCGLPKTVKNLRSFIGAYKALSRVIPNTASFLAPLDTVCAGRDSPESIEWTEDLTAVFTRAQKALRAHKAVVLPRPDDQLWIVTDGSVKLRGIGATFYVTRNNRTHLAGYFSAKLRKNQVNWLPCEVEALGIAAAVKHFAPFIRQSNKPVTVLTDSKPCVQAALKLTRGEFSASPRVTTFLSTVSRYSVSVCHLAGSENVPSDFASRNAPECSEPRCQVCSFVSSMEDAPVRHISAQDVLAGTARMPFIGRQAWQETQQECANLRRTKTHLSQGTRPSKKETKIKDVKRYLQVSSISRDGLLVVKCSEPFASTRKCIIVPRSAVPGLLHAIHLKLNHPTLHQMKQTFIRYFYALDLDSAITSLYKSCHTCASLRKLPPPLVESSTTAPSAVGVSYSADVMHYFRQRILILRETVTGFTQSSFIPAETAESLEATLIPLCLSLRSPDGPPVTVRVDPAPGFVRLRSSDALCQIGVRLEIGRIKNPNKNPVAEHAIGELRAELKRANPEGGCISSRMLAIATSRLNSRIRHSGMSSWEMFFARDQFTNDLFHISDRQLIAEQQTSRLENHPHDYASKSRIQRRLPSAHIRVGDLVYLARDRDKSRPRDRYLVTSLSNGWCEVRKFTGSQFRSKTYDVRLDECYHVPSDVHSIPEGEHYRDPSQQDQSDDECDYPHTHPAAANFPTQGPETQHTPLPRLRPRQNLRPPDRLQYYA